MLKTKSASDKKSLNKPKGKSLKRQKYVAPVKASAVLPLPGIEHGKYSADFVLRKALDIGENILCCGGEPHRIEDTVERICRSYGAVNTDVFALPSLIVASIDMPGETDSSSQVRRVYQTSNNLYLLEAMNRVSRRVCSGELELSEVDAEIDAYKNKRPFPDWLCCFGGALAAGAFAVFFGGTVYDGVAAAAAGTLVSIINLKKPAFMNQMIFTVMSSFFGALLAILLVKLGVGNNADKIMIGTIMLVIPGLSFGNAVRDLLFGDTVSGLIQLVQAILLAVMVAFGFTVAILIMRGVAF